MNKPSADPLASQLRELPAFRALLRGVECRLFRAAGELPAPVLDLGCGDGHFAALAYGTRPEIGVDPHPGRLLEARRRASHVNLIAATGEALPLAEASMGSVVANCVLEHIPRLDAALEEIYRVLRPGGRLVFGVPSHLFADMLWGSTTLRRVGLKRLGRAYGDWFNRHSRHFHTDPPGCWRQRLAGHGFEVEHWEYYISAEGLRAFDMAHYLGIPRLVSHRLTGRWVSLRVPGINRLFERWLRPYYEAPAPRTGAYLFFHVRKPVAPAEGFGAAR